MRRKNAFIFMLVALFVVSLFSISGCAEEAVPEEPEVDEPEVDEPVDEEPEPDEPVSDVTRVNMGAGWVTGVYYPLAGAMSRIAHTSIDNISLTVESSGASAVNSRMIGSHDLDMAIVQNDVAYYAFHGEGEAFAGNPVENMRGMFVLYPEPVQLVAAAGSGIESPADLAGKSVALGPLGSGAEVNALQVLDAAGLTEDDLESAERLEAGEAADFLRDGRVDAAFFTVGIGASVIDELSVMTDIYLVNIVGDIAQSLIETYPFYASVTIPGDTYSNVPEADTIAVLSMIVTREDMDADLVYDFMRGIFDNIDVIHGAHDVGRLVTLDTALDGMSVPLHPGAERFFDEEGMSY